MKQIPTYPLRRHRPGHTTRMPDIRAFLDANSGSDPLQGNYVLIKLEDIVLNFQGESNLFELMAFTAAAGALQQTGRYTGTQIGGSPVAICAGDFDGDGADEIASLYNDAGQLNLLLARNADPATGTQSLSVVTSKENIGTYGGGQLRAVATPIAGRKNLGFIFAWAESGSLSVQVWTTDSSLRPNLYAEGTLTLKIADSNFDLTTADLDGDGVFEIVVLYQGTPQNNQNLFLSTLKLNEQDKLVLDATAAVAEMDGPCQLAISAGAHDPQSVSEQVAVAWSQGGYGKVVLYIYNSGILTPSGSPYVDEVNPLTDSQFVRVASGDLNMDGVDEVVLGTVGRQSGEDALLVLHVLQAEVGQVLQLDSKSVGVFSAAEATQAFVAVDLALAIGEIGNAQLNGVVVGTLGSVGVGALEGKAYVNVGLVQVDPSSLRLQPASVDPITNIGQLATILTYPNEAFDKNLNLRLSMTLGDFSKASIRVGPPEYFSLDAINNIIAILNVPPFDDQVNKGNNILTFHNSQGQDTSIGVTVSRNWNYSKNLGGNLSVAGLVAVDASMTRTYGHGFSKTNESSNSFSEDITLTIQAADTILFDGRHYDVWEYPVYDDASGQVKGYLLVLFPDTTEQHVFDCPSTSFTMPYFPDHQPGVLTSYPLEAPADFVDTGAIAKLVTLPVDLNQSQLIATWSKGTTVAKESSSSVSLDYNVGLNFTKEFNFLGGVGIGLNANFSGDYSDSKSSTHEITFSDLTSISVLFNALTDVSQQYAVTPYIYYSNEGGFLVVDYAIEIPSEGYWVETYNEPTASFNKLWASSTDKNIVEYTRSIMFNAPDKDGRVLIIARVANYSFVETLGVKVTFYLGDPKDNGVMIGEPQIVASIQPLARQDVNVLWQPRSQTPTSSYKIYVTLEPTPGGSQFTPSRGYGVWPPQPLQCV